MNLVCECGICMNIKTVKKKVICSFGAAQRNPAEFYFYSVELARRFISPSLEP